MKKIGELNALAGNFVLYYDEKEKYNHYKIYQREWYNRGWHRKLIDKYADLSSCMQYLARFILYHNEEGR